MRSSEANERDASARASALDAALAGARDELAGARAFGHYPDSSGESSYFSYEGAGWCLSDLDAYMPAASVDECWSMCSEAYPDSFDNLEFAAVYECYCQSSCDLCMADVGESSTCVVIFF